MRIAVYAANQTELLSHKNIIEAFKIAKTNHPVITSYHTYKDLLIHEDQLDVIFLALERKCAHGIELASQLRHRHKHAKIIFTSDHAYFVEESYDLNAYHFFINPLSKTKIHRVLDELYSIWITKSHNYIRIYDGIYSHHVLFEQIVYIEVTKHRVTYHLFNNKTIECWGSLKDIEQTLSKDKRFIKCYRSYIININFVTKFRDGSLTIQNKQEIPISRKIYRVLKLKNFTFNL